jgi:hypothetical protein
MSTDPVKRDRQLANLRPGPPAPPANGLAERHGAHKTLPVRSAAAAIYAELEQETPLREGDGDLPAADRTAVELLASCLARLASIGAWLHEHGAIDPEGQPRPVLEVERRLRNEAADHCAALGLTPRARLAIGLDLQRGVGASLAELLSEIPEPGEVRDDG